MNKLLINLLLFILLSCDKNNETILNYSYLEDRLVINEINYNSSDDFNPGDWIEFYNNTDGLLDISNWFFKDENDSHIFTFSDNTIISEGEYIVLCNDTSSFIELFSNVNFFLGNLDFGFNGNGEELSLYNSENKLVDFVIYDDNYPWPIEPDGNGQTLELIDPLSDNAHYGNWQASYAPNGTPGEPNSTLSDSILIPSESYNK